MLSPQWQLLLSCSVCHFAVCLAGADHEADEVNVEARKEASARSGSREGFFARFHDRKQQLRLSIKSFAHSSLRSLI